MKKSFLTLTVVAAFCVSDATPDLSQIANADEQSTIVVAEYSGPIPAGIDEVWRAFTTAEGLSSFYVRKAVIEPEPGGQLEMHVFPDNPPGQRGIEGQIVLAVEPERRLMTTWMSPLHIREKVGPQLTVQEILLKESGPNETIVTLRQFGFGETPDWDSAKWYFELRQRDVYLSLRERFESPSGTVNWDVVMARFWATTKEVKRRLMNEN